MRLQAIWGLASCQLTGQLEGTNVILDTDQNSLRLLRLACLGTAAPKAGQTSQSIEGAIEHTDPAESLSALTGTEAGLNPAEIQASTTLDTSQTHTAARDGDQSCLPAILPAQATATGAICQIGCLGPLPVTLPASQAVLIESQCAIAFSRTAAENLRLQGHDGSSAEDQPKRDSTQNNKQQRYNGNCLCPNCTRSWLRVYLINVTDAMTSLQEE